ncbi:unnamed protein product, partial [Brassica oleracea var. botrytis]
MTRSHCYCFSGIIISLLIHTLASPPLHFCLPDQRDALLEFKDEFPIDESNPIAWNNTSTDCCFWKGITCNDRSGQVKMVKKTKGRLEAERQEAESQEFALRGKALTSEPTGSGTQRTVRQRTLAAKKSKEHEKRAGKSVPVPTYEEGETESEDEPAPTKKAKMSKGKGVAVDRDRTKTPSVEELYDHLKNGVTWAPTRFADLGLLKELGLESDIETMLGHLKTPK